jgi:hypothetical protein
MATAGWFSPRQQDSLIKGAGRYSSNTAGNLVKVESDDGLGWSLQAQMIYDGLWGGMKAVVKSDI